MAKKLPPIETRFKKGQSGNPLGGKLHNPAVKALRKITLESFRESIELVMTGNVAELQALVKAPDTPGVQVAIASAFLKAIRDGDYSIVERLAERIVGKIPDELNVKSINANLHTELDPEKVKAALEKLQSDV